MAKRPCSVTLTADDSTILCADKFGDVYALPLLPDPEAEQNGVPESETDHKKFVPSASLLTVHSGRNRKTLEDQLKQAEKGPSQSKEAPKFKHDLLLGHVSMLTDITYTTAGPRSYILTADRDEHIRVSRGPPQAHIIEGFCQGHEEFVSRLCLLKSGRLVSGGGDPHLYIWDWLSYRLLQKIPIRDAVQDHYRSRPQLTQRLPQEGELKIAVSGIWSVPGDNAEVNPPTGAGVGMLTTRRGPRCWWLAKACRRYSAWWWVRHRTRDKCWPWLGTLWMWLLSNIGKAPMWPWSRWTTCAHPGPRQRNGLMR